MTGSTVVQDATGFAALTVATEAWLVRDLALRPLPLDPALAHAEGVWKGAPVAIDTRAYRGGPIRYARFAVVRGAGLEIGNLLLLPDVTHPLPILGADLVALRQESGMVAVDLSPTLPPGPERDAQLADLARRRALQPPFPSGGRLPDWCATWFSPHALYTRGPLAELAQVADAFNDFPRAFVELARRSGPQPALAAHVAAVQEGYAAAHRTDDKGLNLLAKMFGGDWAERYVGNVLFPAVAE